MHQFEIKSWENGSALKFDYVPLQVVQYRTEYMDSSNWRSHQPERGHHIQFSLGPSLEYKLGSMSFAENYHLNHSYHFFDPMEAETQNFEIAMGYGLWAMCMVDGIGFF